VITETTVAADAGASGLLTLGVTRPFYYCLLSTNCHNFWQTHTTGNLQLKDI